MSDYAARLHAANDALLVRDDFDAIPEYFASDYRAHAGGRIAVRGHDAIRQVCHALRDAFGDLYVEVEVFVADGERVAWQRTLTGTHRAAYHGFPATGRAVTWREMFVSRLADDRIAEEWVVSDLAEQLLRARKA